MPENESVDQTADIIEAVDTTADTTAADTTPADTAVVDAAAEIIEVVEIAEAAEVVVEVTDTPAKTEAVQAEATDDAAADDADAEPTVTFGSLGLPDGIVRKLAQNGVTAPFPIQAATIPDALAGKDILGRGRTGSGKTLSFGLPLLATLSGGHTDKKKPRGIILTPTRELAMQVADALQPYGDVLGLKMKVVCGGTSMSNQMYALERGVDVLVATPGRLRDLINRGACSLADVRIAVLDEADQMSDLGFLPEVTELLDQIPGGGQRMLFSATMENEISTLVKRYLTNPVTHEVDSAQGNVTTMTHHVLVVKPKDKAPVTAAIAARKGRTIIFVRTQLGADRIAEQLRESGVKSDALHGGMTQGARTRVLEDFKKGYINALVATDVAARGIHVDGIDLVLNVDPAGDHKDYLHRSGRTARAGKSGVVVSLSLPHQRRQIFRMMEDAGVEASRHIVAGAGVFEPEVAEITGARSLTEVQADSANNAAKQAEREVKDMGRELERTTRRATELREEADRLVARAARERGEDPDEAIAEMAKAAEAENAAVAAAAAAVQERQAAERRDERGNFERRGNDRGGYKGNNDRGGDRGGYKGRDDRGGSSSRPAFNRDDRGGSSSSRPAFNRDDRGGSSSRPAFNRDDRGGSSSRPAFNRDDRGGDRRDDRGGSSRPAFNRDDRGGDRRDDRGGSSRPAFNRDDRGGDRSARPATGGGFRAGGSDRPFNRDDRAARPATGGGFRAGSSDRPASRRDDHRGSTGTGTGSFGRRDEKPRWKRS
ncbi:DEAD/DEAH box helicase [Streptomyces sp. H27-C3]|uniref:DEAD/DEAH box helicase n=1 Tax=Streptomyces sp. H27-C3 TaxID=3046305 RepID=UPI0024B8D6E6|nr:DEAD/DEAH box helicase [Streptomyces sp. H27-C3]MDJ0463529.1 DEAD/DEAH box helicase [Streptomyces sp. H27-C3]